MSICGFQWTLKHAKVICRQLSMPLATGATNGGRFKPGTGMILADNLDCTGFEANIFDCPYERSDLRCDHSIDAGVICGVWSHGKWVKLYDVGVICGVWSHGKWVKLKQSYFQIKQ